MESSTDQGSVKQLRQWPTTATRQWWRVERRSREEWHLGHLQEPFKPSPNRFKLLLPTNQTVPNYFLVPVHSHQTKAQPVETQTDITGCKPDHTLAA